VTYLQDDDDQPPGPNAIDNAVASHPNSKDVLIPLKLSATQRIGFEYEMLDRAQDADLIANG
jgi:hypothetical protein